MEKIELFLLPFARGNVFYGLLPSTVQNYREEIFAHEVNNNNLIRLLLTRPWQSSRRIICVHWSTTLYGSKYVLKSVILLVMNFLSLAVLKVAYRFKIVWVVHNNNAHDYPNRRIDALGRWLLRAHADVLVAQQEKTRDILCAQYPQKKVVYIPHCNFTALYPSPTINKKEARRRFGFADNDIVLISLGVIRPYKKIELFIDAFRVLDPLHDSRLKLWITGKPDGDYLPLLIKQASGLSNVRIDAGFVSDEELSAYARCADYAVFYFDESELTSGSLLLALSLGLPVIARDIAGAEILENGKNGFVFKNIPEMMDVFSTLGTKTIPPREHVLTSLHGTDFLEVERAYMELYDSLV